MAKPINIFIIYAREDKEEKKILLDFLSPMIEAYNLTIWHDDHIQPGQEWKPHIESRLNITDIFILLVSVNFLNSKFIKQVEFKYALDRHREKKSIVIPVIIRYCLWDDPLPYDNYSFSLNQLQVLPAEGKPIVEWKSADEAYSNIAKGIRSVIIERRTNQKKQELQEDEFWNQTVQKHSISSYNEYIEKYPDGKFYEEAKNEVISLEQTEKETLERNKQEIEEANTASERKEIEEKILWRSTCDINTITAYKNYLEKNESGLYREQANKFIAEIEKKNRETIAEQERLLSEEQENKLWEEVAEENTIHVYEKYLHSTTVGLFKEKAQEKISQLEAEQKEKEEQELWEHAKTENTTSSYNGYLAHYPNGMYRTDAAAAIKEMEEAERKQQGMQKKKQKVPDPEIIKKRSSKKHFLIGGSAVLIGIIILLVIKFNTAVTKSSETGKPNDTTGLVIQPTTSTDNNLSENPATDSARANAKRSPANVSENSSTKKGQKPKSDDNLNQPIYTDNKNENNSKKQNNTNTSYSIGQRYGGGIIFYIDETGQHGLIAAYADLDANTTMWNGGHINLGETGSEIGTGKDNTKKIIDKLGAGNYAAKNCADLILYGFNDWFLPSKDELNQLCQNRDKVKGLTAIAYWSSTAHNGGVYFQIFNGDGFSLKIGDEFYGSDKSLTPGSFHIRAVRAF